MSRGVSVKTAELKPKSLVYEILIEMFSLEVKVERGKEGRILAISIINISLS